MSLDFSSGSLDWSQLEKNLGANVKGEKKNYKDDRFWTLSRDENDNGGAIIRLLPDSDGTPFIQVYSHAFQSFDNVNKKKRWYINNSPSTINEPCPASDLWSALFNAGTEEGKLEAKNFSRKIQFYANIKVIKDPANPQNEGKIFIWKFGPKLKDKFMAALNPSESDRSMGEEPKELFNPLTGCNIKLKIKKAAGFLNYDDTTIDAPSSIYASAEEAKNDIIENSHNLGEFLKPEAFETYEELSKKLNYVLECYSPKHMNQEIFKNTVSFLTNKVQEERPTQTRIVDEQSQDTVQDQTQDTVQTQTQDTVQDRVQTQTQQPTTASNPQDDALAFLDDL